MFFYEEPFADALGKKRFQRKATTFTSRFNNLNTTFLQVENSSVSQNSSCPTLKKLESEVWRRDPIDLRHPWLECIFPILTSMCQQPSHEKAESRLNLPKNAQHTQKGMKNLLCAFAWQTFSAQPGSRMGSSGVA